MRTLLTLLFLVSIARAEDYRIKAPPEALQLMTPDGEKTIIFENAGEEGPRPSVYRLAIPIADLKPSPSPTPAPVAAAPAAAEVAPTETAETDERKPAAIPEEAKYDDSDRMILEANYLFNRGDYFTATLKVDELLKRNPKLTRAWVMKGTLFYVQGFKDLAKSAWEKAYALSANDAEVKRLLEKVQ